VSAFECYGDFSEVEVEQGGWGYHPVTCDIGYGSIEASYIGDLSDKIDVTVSEEDLHEYRISLIVDATDVDNGDYGGRVNLYDDNGSKFAEFDVKLQVGEGEIEEISLSEDRIRFLLEEEGSEECHEVTIKNTGNVDLSDLTADVKSWDDNCRWIEINEIDDEDFKVGEEETLEICVNNRDNCTGWDERRTEIRIETREVKERVEVRLITDREGYWEVNYHELNDKYDFLWKTYLREHNYMVALESLNETHASLMENYTLLQDSYNNLSIRYDELSRKYNILENYSREINESHTLEIAELENEIKKSKNAIRKLNEELADKDSMFSLLERKYTNLSGKGMRNNSSGNVATPGFVGDILRFAGSPDISPHTAGVAVAFGILTVSAVVVFTLVRIRKMRRVKSALDNAGARAGTSLFEKAEEGKKDVQKEKLKKLLMKKLAEKSTEERI